MKAYVLVRDIPGAQKRGTLNLIRFLRDRGHPPMTARYAHLAPEYLQSAVEAIAKVQPKMAA